MRLVLRSGARSKHAVIPRFTNPESAPSSPRSPRRVRAQSARTESRPARGRGGRGPARIRIRAGIRAGARVRTCNLSQFLTVIWQEDTARIRIHMAGAFTKTKKAAATIL